MWRALLVLALLLAAASAQLSGSFCFQLQAGEYLALRNTAAPYSAMYGVNLICTTFAGNSNYTLTLQGIVKQTNSIRNASSQCLGKYIFSSNGMIQFVPTSCAELAGYGGFCGFACEQFSGSYYPYFAPVSAATLFSVGTAPPSQPQMFYWGDLLEAVLMTCNTTSCGSAPTNIINVRK